MSGTGHVSTIDLYDLVSRLEATITGHKTIREDLLHHDTAERSVRASNNGDAKVGAGPGNLHMRHLALQDRKSGDSWKILSLEFIDSFTIFNYLGQNSTVICIIN